MGVAKMRLASRGRGLKRINHTVGVAYLGVALCPSTMLIIEWVWPKWAWSPVGVAFMRWVRLF